jgi:hypothetical protein
MTKRKLIVLTIFLLLAIGLVICLARLHRTVNTRTQNAANDEGVYVKGVLVVGFKKDVSQATAEGILNNLGLKFNRTNDTNRGMKFFTETGEKYQVRVPTGEEEQWLEKILKISEVKDAGRYVDPAKVLVD